MIRARRLAQYAAAAASPSASSVASSSSVAARTVLVRRLHAAPSVVRAVARPTIFAAPRSRFSPLHNGALATATTRRISLPSAQQIRWRSALTDAQQDQLIQRLEELATCRDNGNWRQALKLLDQMDKEGFALDADMYEMAIAACARMGKIEVLPGLLQNMEVDSLLPTNRTIDFIMQAYIAAEEWKLIVKLAKEVTSKGVVLSDAAFQAAFESCGKMRDATSARQIVLNAEHAGASELDASHYAAAIRACGMGGRADIAASLFSHMEEKRGLVADADVFNHLIRSQIVNGAMPQALQTFSMVNERPDVVMPESIYTATIDALVSQGEFWQASQLFGQMLAHKLSPSVFCYGRMMVAYVRLNKHELAHECWERILAIDEPSPNLTKYAKMVSQLATTNDSELAVAIFEHIFPRFDPTQIRDTTYAAAIRAYGRLGRTETALNLFDTFVASRQRVGRPLPRSAGIYLAVFNALSRDSDRDPQQNTRDAKRVWDIMVESVPVVLAPAYASLAGVLASSGDLTTLQELMDHAEESLAQQQDHYARRRRRHTGAMRADQGFNAYDEMMSDEDEDEDAAFDVYEPSGKMTPSWRDELLFNGVISGFSKARSDQSQRVMDYLELMRSRGMTINDSVIRAATDTFVKNEQWQLMYDLMEYVDVRSLQNADVCFGDTISKLLDAGAWEPARFWISRAHRMDVQPPIRGKMEVLRQLSETQSQEWQIAYALARETLSFKQMVQENVESVADAIDVCLAAQRMDLVIKLYERTATHPSVVRAHRDTKIPLRMFKATLLACMREHSTTPDFGDAELTPIQKAEQFCAHMLQMYGGRKGKDVLDGDALSLAISIKATMGDDDDVLALFEKMQQHGFEPNSYACNAAIMAYSRARKINKVLAVRDALLATDSSVLKEPKITQSLLFSVAILNDDQQVARLMAEMRHMLPHVTSDLVISAFLQANRLDKCVEFFDADCSLDLFHSCVRRILDAPSRHVEKQPEPVDVVLSAQLLLKYIALHGLDQLKPPGVLLRIAKRQIKAGNFREALAIIDLYDDPRSEVSLTDMKPTFQTEVLEMRLFLHGEQQSYDLLLEMFEKQAKSASSAPLTDRHYQLAMEYCNALPATVDAHGNKLTKKQQQERLVDGALASLKLFEMLRLQFIKPTGPVYVLALQSCHKLGRLDVTGARVLQDAVAQGFTYELGSELFRLANIGVNERQRALASDATDAVKRRDRKSTRKPEGNFAVNASHLASIALFAHHNGVRMPWKLARKLLEMESELSVDVKNEIEYIKAAAEAAYESAQASGEIARKTPKEATYTERKPRATKAAPGSRWGELYLQKHE